MKQSHTRMASVLFGSALLLGAGAAQAATWSDTFVGYRYGTDFHEPNNPEDVKKNVVQLGHASGYAYGSNFFNVDVLMSDDKDPANGATRGDGGSGAQEIYVAYRTQLHLSKVTGRDFSFGPVKDFALTGGFDLNTKNTAVAPQKQMFVIGPTVKFGLPNNGFADFSVFYRTEKNHNNFATPKDIRFDDTYQLNLAWKAPFQVGPAPFKFQGFADYIGTKGNNTKQEILMRASLMVDVGQVVAGKKDTVYAGVGYEYWHNKFGNNPGTGNQPGLGLKTTAPTLNLEWHL
ncbi:outer membrane protein OmpK [Crenobacter cavernae]|uniref:Outer envelope protein n=1 Tax=Crenobacter cavernae TaxID=2290923 RepID=A0A345Y557_9NEIS|nr:outer membrane protein OmpK [Crenobacter cavernae]AXK39059.1 hypothetical protein DWG20_06185 [Crenobacter cavernae]